MARHYLASLFEPSSIALFGASEREGALGTLVFANLLEGGFKGPVYPINPKRETIQGERAYPDLETLGEPVEMAVVTTPATTVPGIVEQCGQYGVKAMIIMSAGFREVGSAGAKLEQAMIENARRHNIRLLGPNCLGMMRPAMGINATFSKGSALKGRLAVVSQSGALCTAILDWAAPKEIGFSAVVSTGISTDIDFGDVLDYLVTDPHTESILLYVEGVRQSRSFMSGLRAAARAKPVLCMKVGRHESGSKAVMSHTGALVGADDVFEAALRRAGVVRGLRIGDLFAAATILTSHYRLEGESLAIITNGGGPGVMATDRAADLGLPLAELSETTHRQLDEVLPPTWSHGNPIDIIGDAPPIRYAEALKVVLADPGVHGVLVILTPQAMTDPEGVAAQVTEIAGKQRKPVIHCWMGETQVEAGRKRLRAAGLPGFNTPEAAVEAFSYLVNHYRNQQLLVQTPGPVNRTEPPDVEGARLIIEGTLAEGRKVLSETESKALLAAFRIRSAQSLVVRSPNEALVQAEALGLPVAMKINSPNISHKSDAGGVRLGISTAAAVRQTYNEIITSVQTNRPEARIDGVTIEPMLRRPNGRELLVGLINDPLFGPVVTFGSGGIAVEVIGDRAVALPPLNRNLVRDLIDGTKVAAALGQFRHMPPIDRDALEAVLMRVSEIACELPWVRELDINPLIADETGAIAVDARVVVDYYNPGFEPYGHMAIHPYPVSMISYMQLPDGRDVSIRPIRPEDAEIEQAFVRRLSDRSRYFRFMQAINELTPGMLARFTQIDYWREMALIAVLNTRHGEEEIGVARYITNPDGHSCEFAVVVADEWHGKGIAHRLIAQLIDHARRKGLERMEAEILADNSSMLAMVRKLGFHVTQGEDTSIKHAWMRLR